MIMYINLYYVDIIIVYEHNPSLCQHNPSLCNIILYYVIFVQMAFHKRMALKSAKRWDHRNIADLLIEFATTWS